MVNFPITVIDDFFNNPDKVREFALSCSYFPSDTGDWPGVRTVELHHIDQNFFDQFCTKILSIFYDKNYHNIQYDISAHFQKIISLDSNPISSKNKGWIHDDGKVFGGLVYLSHNIDLNSGTSIFKTNNKFNREYIIENNFVKQDFYTSKVDKNYDETFKNVTNMFDETISVKNVYNRLILIDGRSWHAAQNLFTNGVERLTLVFFVNGLENTDQTPISRIKQINL